MTYRISKRTRDEAALICAVCASSTENTYTGLAGEWLNIEGCAAWALARSALFYVKSSKDKRTWDRESYAEAEALLRTGWVP